jgi:ArsR family transcriptional regulator
MESKVEVFKALGDSNRVRILCMLSIRDLCVCEINSVLNVSMSTISSHLKILRNAGLVSSKKDGRWIFYSLNKSDKAKHDIVAKCVQYVSNENEVVEDIKKMEKVKAETC